MLKNTITWAITTTGLRSGGISMAVVPAWQPSVQKQAGSMQPVTAPMQDMGAPVFEGLNKDIAAIKKYQDEQDKYAVSTAYNNAQQQIQQNFYGDNGVFTRKGANALGAADTDTTPAVPDVNSQASSMMSQIRDNAMKGLSTKQQQMLSVALQEPTNTYTMAAAKYQQQQQQVAWDENYKSTNDTLNNAYLANVRAGQTDLASQNLREIMGSEQLYGKQKGLTDDEIKTNISTRMNTAIKNAVINQLTDDNVDGANGVLKEWGDKLDTTTYAEIETKMKPVVARVNSIKISDFLISNYGYDEKQGLAYLKDNYGNDPNYDTYQKRYHSDITVQRVARNQARDDLRESVANQVAACGSDTSTMRDIIAKSGLSPVDQDTLTRKYVDHVETKQKSIAKEAERAAKKGSGKYAGYSDSDKQMLKYQENGYITNYKRYQKLNDKFTNGDDLNDAEKAEYQVLGTKINNFWGWQKSFYGLGGSQGSEDNSQSTGNDSQGTNIWLGTYNDLLANGATPEEAEAMANDMAAGRFK